MRGYPSGNGELLLFSAGDKPAGNGALCPLPAKVLFEELPVGADELAAIEAFLLPGILALLDETAPADSELAQSSESIGRHIIGERRRGKICKTRRTRQSASARAKGSALPACLNGPSGRE